MRWTVPGDGGGGVGSLAAVGLTKPLCILSDFSKDVVMWSC